MYTNRQVLNHIIMFNFLYQQLKIIQSDIIIEPT
jgi:hypothetical protein